MNATSPASPSAAKSDIARDIRQGVLLGAALLALLLPPAPLAPWPSPREGGNAVDAVPVRVMQEPDFGDFIPSDDARELARWIARTGDHGGMLHGLIVKKPQP